MFQASAAGSPRRYWLIDTRLLLPRLANEAAQVEFYAHRSWWPEEAFFGLGPDSLRREHANFSLGNTVVGGSGAVRTGRLLTLGGRAEYPAAAVGTGTREEHTQRRDALPG